MRKTKSKVFKEAALRIGEVYQLGRRSFSCDALANCEGTHYDAPGECGRLWAKMHRPRGFVGGHFTAVGDGYSWFGSNDAGTAEGTKLRRQLLLEAALCLEAQGYGDE